MGNHTRFGLRARLWQLADKDWQEAPACSRSALVESRARKMRRVLQGAVSKFDWWIWRQERRVKAKAR